MAIPHERPEPKKPKKKKPTKKPPQAEAPPRRGDINPSKPGQQKAGRDRPPVPKPPDRTRKPEPKTHKAKQPPRRRPPPKRHKRGRGEAPGPGGPSGVGPVSQNPARVPRAPRDNQGPGPGVGHAPPSSSVAGEYRPTGPGPKRGTVRTISIQRAMKADGAAVKVDGKFGPKTQRALEIRRRAVGQRQRNRNLERIENERVEGRPAAHGVFSPSSRVFGENTGEVVRIMGHRQDPAIQMPLELGPSALADKTIRNTRIMRRRVKKGFEESMSPRQLRIRAHAYHEHLRHTRFNNPENASRARPSEIRAYFFDREFGRWGEDRVQNQGRFIAADVRGTNLFRAYLREHGHRKTVKARGVWDDALQTAVKSEMREWVRVERRQAVRRIEKLFFDTGIVRPPDARDQQLIYLPFAKGYIDLDNLTPRQLHDILENDSPFSKLLFRELVGRLRSQRDRFSMAMEAGYMSSGQRVDSEAMARLVEAEKKRKESEKGLGDDAWWGFSIDAWNGVVHGLQWGSDQLERGFAAQGQRLMAGGGSIAGALSGSYAPGGYDRANVQADVLYDRFEKAHPYWAIVSDIIFDPLNFLPPAAIILPFKIIARGTKVVTKAGERASVQAAEFLPDQLNAVAQLPAIPYHAGVWSAAKADQFWGVFTQTLSEAPGGRHAVQFANAMGKLKDVALQEARENAQLKLIERVVGKAVITRTEIRRTAAAKRMNVSVEELRHSEELVDRFMRELLPRGTRRALPGLSSELVDFLVENRAALYSAEGSAVYSKLGAVVVAKLVNRVRGSELSDLLWEEAHATAQKLALRTAGEKETAQAWRDWAELWGQDPDNFKVRLRYASDVEREAAFKTWRDTVSPGGSREWWEGWVNDLQRRDDDVNLGFVDRGGFQVGDAGYNRFVQDEFARLLVRSPLYLKGMGDPRVVEMVEKRLDAVLKGLHDTFLPRLQKMISELVPREELFDPATGKALVNREEMLEEINAEVRAIFERPGIDMPNPNYMKRYADRAMMDLKTGEIKNRTERIQFQRSVDEATGVDRPEYWDALMDEERKEVEEAWLIRTRFEGKERRAFLDSKGVPRAPGWYDTRAMLEVPAEYALHLMDHEDSIRGMWGAFTDDMGQEFREQITAAFGRKPPGDLVRHANGDPVLFHHGTAAEFEKFADEFMGTGLGLSRGRGFYFSREREFPRGVAEIAAERTGGVARLVAVNLSYSRPLRATDEVTPLFLDRFAQAADELGLRGPSFDEAVATYREVVVREAAGRGGPLPSTAVVDEVRPLHDFLYAFEDKAALVDVLQRMGYDAIESLDEVPVSGSKGFTEVIVFSDRQIHDPAHLSRTAGAVPDVSAAADVFRHAFNQFGPQAPKPWDPDMGKVYAGIGISEAEFKRSLLTHRTELEVTRRGDVVAELKKQGAYWQALRHAQGKGYRALYFGLAGAMGTWRFFTLAMNPGWVVRNVGDNFAKVLMQGVVDPRAWWYEGAEGALRSIFDVDVARMRDAMRFIDKMHGHVPGRAGSNAASDWFERTIEAGFWSAPLKQIESVFRHYDVPLDTRTMEMLTFAFEGDRIMPRFHPANKGKVIPGRAPSRVPWGSEERVVHKWRDHWGGFKGSRLRGERIEGYAPSGQKFDVRTGELLPMSEWEHLRMGVDPSTGQYVGAWVARMHDNIWELFGSRPENFFKRVLYRDTYKKAIARGQKPHAAAEEAWLAVEKTLFDYSKITVIEDNLRIFFPFIQFWRKNFKFWLTMGVEKPWFLGAVGLYHEGLEDAHKDLPPWMRRYLPLKEVSDIIARVPGLMWLAEELEDAAIDPFNYFSFAPLYRAFKSANPNLPPEEAGLPFLSGFIDALNEWGMSLNPFIRKPLEWVGVLNLRSWQSVFPQTQLVDAFTEKYLHELFPDGFNFENWLSDPILNALGKDTMSERQAQSFNYYVHMEMAAQGVRGEPISRPKAETKIRQFFYAKTLLGFFAGTYVRRMTPEDIYFSQMSYGMAMGSVNFFDLTPEEKAVYRLYKFRNFDIAQYDAYVEALPLVRSYYGKSYDDAQQMLLAHPELIPFVSTNYGRKGSVNPTLAQEIYLQSQHVQTMGGRGRHGLFALIERTDIDYELKKVASSLLTTPDLKRYWARNDEKRVGGLDRTQMQYKLVRGQYQKRIDDLHRNFYAISDWDREAREAYLTQHPELERYWQVHGSASDDFRTVHMGVERTLRDRYFEILETKNAQGEPSWDEAIDFLQQFPFIFDGTAKRRMYREVARVGHFPGYVPGGYARRGGGWRDFGISEHAADYLNARPYLNKFFDLMEKRGKEAAYDWLNSNTKGAKIVQAYFDEYGDKKKLTPKARDYLKARKALDHFFDLPKGQRDKWLWGRSAAAKLVREYFRKYAQGGLKRFEDRPMSQHQKDYLEAKDALKLYFGMSEAERVKWLQGDSPEAAMVREYFDKYADERGQTQHARDYLKIKPVLEEYFALPKGAGRRAFLDAHPELEDYFAKYSDTDKTEKSFTVDGRGGQYAPAHWSYGHSQRYQGRGASRGPGSFASFDRFFASKDPKLRRRLEFWRIYFSLPPDQRPQFVLDHADEYGVFVYGALGPQDIADKETDLMAKAFAFAQNGDRSLLYGLLQPLIDFYFSLEDPAEQQLMLRGNPELQRYFDLTAAEISTGDPALDALLEQYFKLPKGSRMRTILLDQNPALKAWIEENSTQEDDALHALLEVYFRLSSAEKKQYRIDHPELQEYFDKRSEEKDNEKMQLEAFDRADPRLKKYFDAAKEEIEYAAWLRKQQMQHESLKEIAIEQRRDRRQKEQLSVMAY